MERSTYNEGRRANKHVGRQRRERLLGIEEEELKELESEEPDEG